MSEPDLTSRVGGDDAPDAPQPETFTAENPGPARTTTSFVKCQVATSIMTLRGLNVVMSMMTAPKFTDKEAQEEYFRALAEDIKGWRNDLAMLGKELGAMLAVAENEVNQMMAAGVSTDVAVPTDGSRPFVKPDEGESITGAEKEFDR